MKKEIFLRCCIVVLACMALATIVNAKSNGDQGNPGVSPPNSNPHGLSYGEWSARWWQWAFSIPASTNPLIHDEAPCSLMQTGNVWFLAGKGFGSVERIGTRNCTIPTGTFLFFPVANAVNDNTNGLDSQGYLRWYDPWVAPDDLRAQLEGFLRTSVFSCIVDGKQIDGLDSMTESPYRVKSPVFSTTLPVTAIPGDNLWGIDLNKWTPPPPFPNVPTGTIPGVVADGAYLMLKPLSPGLHTIWIAADFGGGNWFEVTYYVDVLPNGQFKK